MTAIVEGIFRRYDIRGVAAGAGATLTPDVARQVGQAFGTYLQQVERKNHVIVGRDNRTSSPRLARAVGEGLTASGCHVADIGLVATPVLYWRAVRQGDGGGVMVTGSHLPPQHNGCKLCVGSRTLYGEQIQQLRAMIAGGRMKRGAGRLVREEGARDDYVRDLAGRLAMARRLKVVVDAGNGTGGLCGPALIEKWGHDVVCIFCEPDENYPHHHPDPLQPENMRALSAAVREQGADVGIAFDGDADRMGVVDENGASIAADRVLALLAQDMLARNPGAAVVVDVVSSQVVLDAIAHAGGRAVMSPSGHSLVKAAMRETGALLGGEVSAHIFLAEDYYGFDDGHFAAGRLLQLLAASGQTLSQLDATLPTLYSTPVYRPFCPEELKGEVIEGMKAALADKGEMIDIDGVRLRFEKGWGLIRASNTEAALTLRFEGETEADARAYRDLFAAELRRFPQVGPLDG